MKLRKLRVFYDFDHPTEQIPVQIKKIKALEQCKCEFLANI